MINLKGKAALVTGGGRGIGRDIAFALAKAGADVAVCDIDLNSAQATAKDLEAVGVKAAGFKANVADAADVGAMFAAFIETFGHLDILVNNAGITRDNLIMRMKEEDWDLVLSINLKSAFLCCKEATRPMMKARAGKIINIASVVGLMGNAGQANYSASKAGLIGLTKTLARELSSRNITVNAVAPGFIVTAMTDKLPEEEKARLASNIPLGRLGSTQDVANAVLFLSSPLADYVTGQTLAVDGGFAMQS
jgi:3-oxoacyl-[acyl-carrier protein] reductase